MSKLTDTLSDWNSADETLNKKIEKLIDEIAELREDIAATTALLDMEV